jgi:hypothetical protein
LLIQINDQLLKGLLSIGKSSDDGPTITQEYVLFLLKESIMIRSDIYRD